VATLVKIAVLSIRIIYICRKHASILIFSVLMYDKYMPKIWQTYCSYMDIEDSVWSGNYMVVICPPPQPPCPPEYDKKCQYIYIYIWQDYNNNTRYSIFIFALYIWCISRKQCMDVTYIVVPMRVPVFRCSGVSPAAGHRRRPPAVRCGRRLAADRLGPDGPPEQLDVSGVPEQLHHFIWALPAHPANWSNSKVRNYYIGLPSILFAQCHSFFRRLQGLGFRV